MDLQKLGGVGVIIHKCENSPHCLKYSGDNIIVINMYQAATVCEADQFLKIMYVAVSSRIADWIGGIWLVIYCCTYSGTYIYVRAACWEYFTIRKLFV